MTLAMAYAEFGGPDVLAPIDVADASPSAGQLGVRIEAIGVNPIDAKLRSGLRSSSPLEKPRVPGTDAAGVVTAVGNGVEGFRVGDAVALRGVPGSYAEAVVVDATLATPRPSTVSAAEAAALGVPAGTAYQSLRSLAVGAGDTLLLHGGSGSVGQAAIQYAALWGARVIATASERRFDRVRALGATPVAYGPGLADRVREIAPDGVTVALDCAGTDEALDVSIELVGDRDRIATLVRGRDADARGIRAFSGGSPHPLDGRQLAWRAEAMPVTLALLAAGVFSIELGPSLPLREAAESHRLVEAGTDGKITLVP
jgi:enoyl reductase